MRSANSARAAPHERLELLVEQSIKTARTARKNRASLAGMNFYADKLAHLRTDAAVTFQELGDPSIGDVSAMAEMLEIVFAASTELTRRVAVSRELVHELRTRKWQSGLQVMTDDVFPLSLLVKTRRGYLIAVGRQMNGCFVSAWYDACAVMMRRLLETVIIEAFETHKLDSKIKNNQGDFIQLTDLVNAAISETAWNLSRNAKKALPLLRDVGHISAHSRRFTAQKNDIEKLVPHCRIALEEFLHLAGLLDGSS